MLQERTAVVLFSFSPDYGLLAGVLQELVAGAEVPVAEKAPVRAQRTGVCGFEYQMRTVLDQGFLAAGMTAPQHEHLGPRIPAQMHDAVVGEALPAVPGMACSPVGLYGESAVEKQHTLSGPARQITRPWSLLHTFVDDLLVDVLQRWRLVRPLPHRERQAHGLAGLVVRILTHDDDLDLAKRRQAERVEDLVHRRIDGMRPVFALQERPQLQIVRLDLLLVEQGLPVVAHIDHDNHISRLQRPGKLTNMARRMVGR